MWKEMLSNVNIIFTQIVQNSAPDIYSDPRTMVHTSLGFFHTRSVHITNMALAFVAKAQSVYNIDEN